MQKPTTKARTERLRRGLTLRALAAKCAEAGVTVDHSQLNRIERGEFTPRPALRAVLAQLLDMDVDDFEKEPADA